jgi:hypothetical protein
VTIPLSREMSGECSIDIDTSVDMVHNNFYLLEARVKNAVSVLSILLAMFLFAPQSYARDWYVAPHGKGKKGTVEKPSKDLGNIIKKLEPGDVIHIAEGVYTGRGDNGSNKIEMPVSIIGGYDKTFKKRDPWGAHRTIFGGTNTGKNYTSNPSLFMDLMKYSGPNKPIVVDGLIIDMGARNRYKTPAQDKLLPKAKPATGENPSPSTGGLIVRVSKSEKFDRGPRWDITVQNNVVINCYGNQACLGVSGYKGSKIKVRNNVVAQHSGHGIYIGSKFAGNDDFPKFDVENNTVVFSWDSGFSQGFNIGFDRSTSALVKNNVFAFSDIYSIWNGYKSKGITLVDNVVTGAKDGDFLEFGTVMQIDEIEDEAEYLGDDTEGNISDKVVFPVSATFAKKYGSRVVVDREKLEANVKATNSGANDLRSMLGLPVQAGSVEWPKIDVYLNRLSVDDALKIAEAAHKGKYGASKSHIK